MISRFMEATGLVLDVVTPTEVRGHLQLGADQHTPWGVIHGGVYAAAVETAASTGASCAVESQGLFAVGLTNVTNFVRASTGGVATLVGRALHQGRTQQLWEVDITDVDGKLLARGELRLQNLPLP
jgi:uncharacterized protein (TIGR00369 family)